MSRLPYVDTHRQTVAAPRAAVWDALLAVMRTRMSASSAFARLLGCDPAHATAAFEGRTGETVPGFRVADAEPGERLVLHGRHRFADYALTFAVEDGGLSAVTHAEFPGLRGALYRALVIGSGAHAVVTRRLLRQMASAAARSAPPAGSA